MSQLAPLNQGPLSPGSVSDNTIQMSRSGSTPGFPLGVGLLGCSLLPDPEQGLCVS